MPVEVFDHAEAARAFARESAAALLPGRDLNDYSYDGWQGAVPDDRLEEFLRLIGEVSDDPSEEARDRREFDGVIPEYLSDEVYRQLVDLLTMEFFYVVEVPRTLGRQS